jgi:hypothetical protein
MATFLLATPPSWQPMLLIHHRCEQPIDLDAFATVHVRSRRVARRYDPRS